MRSKRNSKAGDRTLRLVYRWPGKDALPRQRMRSCKGGKANNLSTASPNWIKSGEAGKPFDFCGHVERLLEDIALRCPELGHVRAEQVLLCATQARKGSRFGLQARVTPLRFADGNLRRTRGGVVHQVQRFAAGTVEYLYLMTFCLPRFLDQDFEDKFVTIFHEMFHIGPRFDGDLRRHGGRYDLHSHSKKEYDRHMAHLARAYLGKCPDSSLYDFLRLNFGQLERKHGEVTAVVVPRPRIVPLVHASQPARTAATILPDKDGGERGGGPPATRRA